MSRKTNYTCIYQNKRSFIRRALKKRYRYKMTKNYQYKKIKKDIKKKWNKSQMNIMGGKFTTFNNYCRKTDSEN